MNIGKRGLVLAMEEEELIPTDVPPVEEAPAEVPAEVEADAAEVAAGEREISDLNEAIEEAVEDAETLDSIREVMVDSVEPAEPAEGAEPVEGEGMDETAAEVVEVAVEALCSRLGIRNSKIVPSMEAFGSANSRVTATRLAIESVGEKIKKVWEAIKAALAKAWAAVKAFIMKLVDSNLRLEAAANSLLKKIESGADIKGGEEIANDSLANAFSGSDVNAAKDMLAQHVLFSEAVIVGFDSMVNIFKSADGQLGQVLAGKEFDGDAVTKAVEDALKKLEIQDFSVKKTEGNVTTTTWGPFVNGTKLVSSIEILDSKLPKVTLSVVEGEKKGGKVTSLNKAQCIELCKEVIGLTKTTGEFKAKYSKIEAVNKAAEKLLNDAIKGADKMMTAINDGEETNTGKALKDFRSTIQSVSGTQTKLLSRVPSFNVFAGKLALNYVSASAKLSGKAEEKKEETKPEEKK